MKKYLQQTEINEVKTWISVNLVNYLKNNPEDIGEIEHIIDYMNSNDSPNRLKKMSYNQANISAKSWITKLNNQAAKIYETEIDTKVIINFDGGNKLVQLVTKDSFIREGKLMGHCVASYHNKSNCFVYSLRDIANMPHCTIEVMKDNDNINQIKGKGNGSIHPKYIKYILKSLKKIGKEIKESELTYLGYDDTTQIDGLLDFLEANFTGIKFLMFNNKKFLYRYSKLKRK